MREREEIPDVEVQRAARLTRRIWRAVGLDLVLRPFDEGHRLVEIGNRAIELACRDVSMTAMPVHPRVVRMRLNALTEHGNRVLVAPQVSESASDPDHRVGVIRLCREVF